MGKKIEGGLDEFPEHYGGRLKWDFNCYIDKIIKEEVPLIQELGNFIFAEICDQDIEMTQIDTKHLSIDESHR